MIMVICCSAWYRMPGHWPCYSSYWVPRWPCYSSYTFPRWSSNPSYGPPCCLYSSPRSRPSCQWSSGCRPLIEAVYVVSFSVNYKYLWERKLADCMPLTNTVLAGLSSAHPSHALAPAFVTNCITYFTFIWLSIVIKCTIILIYT